MSNGRNTGKKFKPVLLAIKCLTQGHGDSQGSIVVYANGGEELLPRKLTFVVDPANHGSVRLATHMDREFIERIESCNFVMAFTQQWVLDKTGLSEFSPELPE